MRTREQDVEPFVNLSELTEIELLIVKRMREFSMGEHRSLFHGAGYDLVGTREWAPGDRMSLIDWPRKFQEHIAPISIPILLTLLPTMLPPARKSGAIQPGVSRHSWPVSALAARSPVRPAT